MPKNQKLNEIVPLINNFTKAAFIKTIVQCAEDAAGGGIGRRGRQDPEPQPDLVQQGPPDQARTQSIECCVIVISLYLHNIQGVH